MYWSVRPVTVIRAQLDSSWLPYIATPPFPSYPSGHSTTSGAASAVLAAFFPSRAAELDGIAEEAAVSRLYSGIHFRSDNEAGLVLAAAWAARRPLPCRATPRRREAGTGRPAPGKRPRPGIALGARDPAATGRARRYSRRPPRRPTPRRSPARAPGSPAAEPT